MVEFGVVESQVLPRTLINGHTALPLYIQLLPVVLDALIVLE